MSELQFSGDLVVNLLGLAAVWGALMWRITALEKKVEKHNNLVERMAAVERDVRSAHHRLDDWKEEH